jgi:metallophosphoesterase (TIGR00282 family)
MNILFIGDIVGRPGRDLVRAGLDALVRHHQVDFVIANAENAAGGFGVTREVGDDLLALGVDVMTSGNHIWDKKEAIGYIGVEARLLRPANYPAGVPGRGSYVGRARNGRAVAVVNAMGRVFMLNIDDPFTVVVREIENVRERTPIVIVDFHAEATSEKIAMGWHVAGKATAIVGTHTHVQTADDRILPGGTAYITDVGMTGPHDGIIGVDREPALARFLNAMPARFDTASGDLRLHAVLIAADAETGRAGAITRLSLSLADLHALAATTYDEAGTPGTR